jgi:hypothetical protein
MAQSGGHHRTVGTPQDAGPATEHDTGLAAGHGRADLGACLRRFDIGLVRDSAGRQRLYGDINRMQEAVDGGCGPLVPQDMSRDFTAEFHEVDRRTADCLIRKGVHARYDPARGIEVDDELNANPALLDDCLTEAYAFYATKQGALDE